MDLPRDALDIAAAQHGLITRSQLVTAGATKNHLAGWCRRGVLDPIGRRVLRVPGAPRSELQELAAAALETGGVISHRSAARLHGVGTFPAQHPPEVTQRRLGSDYALPLAAVRTTTWLPAEDHLLHQGIPCFSVARTLFSLAAMVPAVPEADVREAVDQAVRERKASDPWLWARLEGVRRRGRPGVKTFERILTVRSGGTTESWLEDAFLDVLTAAGVRHPRCQARIGPHGKFLARVDFLYELDRIVIEVTGSEAHASQTQRASDARRRNELQQAGYLVLEFTYLQVVHESAWVVDRVLAALNAASASRTA